MSVTPTVYVRWPRSESRRPTTENRWPVT